MSNEWYTPAKYIEAAREVMGGIDLDPASCEMANKTVKATRYYTKEENGLMQPWAGRVWLNPPYGRMHTEHATSTKLMRRSGGGKSILAIFLAKLLQEYRLGRVEQAVLLVTADTDASWFQPLWQFPLCFADHRVLFDRPGQTREGQIFGTCFAYLGPHEDRFIDIFRAFGRIVRAIDTPKPRPIACELWQEVEA